jgi:multidrug resistance efflux pump
LERSAEGNLISTLKDYQYNSIADFSVSEFQRGDHAGFELSSGIFNNQLIKKGDTIGRLISQYETANLTTLEGELKVQQKLLDVYQTGEKPELIGVANEKRILARQDFETQQKITNRNKLLHSEGHISDEAFEISQNELNIRRQNMLIAENEYEAMKTGAKEEQIEYVLANIEALENRLDQIQQLFDKYILTSPIDGKIIRQQESAAIETQTVVKIANTNRFVLIVPVDTYNIQYMETGQKISFSGAWGDQSYTATVTAFDNSAQRINGREKVFVTAVTDSLPENHTLFPNMVTDVEIPSQSLSVFGYISRLINEIYNN